MNLLFLADAALNDAEVEAMLGGGLAAMIMAMIGVFIVVFILVYVFTSLVFYFIAKKAKYKSPGLAWIPYVGPLIVTNRISGMHWWPLLLLIGTVIPVINIFASLAVFVFGMIWLWKTFEVIGKPGWWALLCLIPIVNIVLLCIAAWGK